MDATTLAPHLTELVHHGVPEGNQKAEHDHNPEDQDDHPGNSLVLLHVFDDVNFGLEIKKGNTFVSNLRPHSSVDSIFSSQPAAPGSIFIISFFQRNIDVTELNRHQTKWKKLNEPIKLKFRLVL